MGAPTFWSLGECRGCPTVYPFDVITCLTAIGLGVTELVANSSTWSDASARVSIEVME